MRAGLGRLVPVVAWAVYGFAYHRLEDVIGQYAAIVGLEALKVPCEVDLWSDSEYVVKGFSEGRVRAWQRRGWKRERNKPVINLDLWQRLVALVDRHEVRFHWVKGHAGHPENERADELAVLASQAPDLAVDVEYEKLLGSQESA